MGAICNILPPSPAGGGISCRQFVYEADLCKLEQLFVNPYFRLHLVYKGKATLCVEKEKYALAPGTLFITFPISSSASRKKPIIQIRRWMPLSSIFITIMLVVNCPFPRWLTFSVSAGNICPQFSKNMEVNFTDSLAKVRVEKAMATLEKEKFSVAELAGRCGFFRPLLLLKGL